MALDASARSVSPGDRRLHHARPSPRRDGERESRLGAGTARAPARPIRPQVRRVGSSVANATADDDPIRRSARAAGPIRRAQPVSRSVGELSAGLAVEHASRRRRRRSRSVGDRRTRRRCARRACTRIRGSPPRVCERRSTSSSRGHPAAQGRGADRSARLQPAEHRRSCRVGDADSAGRRASSRSFARTVRGPRIRSGMGSRGPSCSAV